MAVDPASEFYTEVHGRYNHQPHVIRFDALELVQRMGEQTGKPLTDEEARAKAADIVHYTQVIRRTVEKPEPYGVPGLVIGIYNWFHKA